MLSLIFALKHRPEATLKVALSHQVASRRLDDGNQASFFNAWIKNRTTDKAEYGLAAKAQNSDQELILKGPTHSIILAGGQNQKVDFVLITPFTDNESQVRFILTSNDGRQLAEADALITPNQSR